MWKHLFRKPHDLSGTWFWGRDDVRALEALGDVAMEFRDNGELIYTIRYPEK